MPNGELPEGWDLAPISSRCTRTETANPARQPRSTFEYIDVSAISNESWSITNSTAYQGSQAPSRARKIVREGDVIFATVRPTLKRVALIPGSRDGQVVSTAFCVLRSVPEKLNNRFLYYSLLTEDFTARMENIQRGASYPAVSDGDVMEQEIPLPPLPEQRAIAGVLSKLQGAVEAQDKIIATLKELKAATLAKLFREGLRGEPLKETEIGEIPESWEVVKLGNLCAPPNGSIQTGPFGSQLHSSEYESSGVPIINPTHMREGRVVSEDIPLISKENALRLKRHTLRKGDILFSRRGDVGLHAYISTNEEGWLCGTGCLIVRVDTQQIAPLFLSYHLESTSPQAYLRSHSVGSIMPNINTTILSSVPVSRPSREEQLEIARTLDTVDQALMAHHSLRKQSAVVFEQMLHLLMTGEVRVTPLMKKAQAKHVAELPARYESGTLDESVLREIVRRIVEAVAPEKIILFGSAARGEMGPDSDVDLLVVKSNVHRRRTAQALHMRLRGVPVAVDLIVAAPEDLEKHKETLGLIYRPALKEGKVIYGR